MWSLFSPLASRSMLIQVGVRYTRSGPSLVGDMIAGSILTFHKEAITILSDRIIGERDG